jgi:phosphoglycerate kinase
VPHADPTSGVPDLDALADVRGRRALVRVDFSVPIRDGTMLDSTRIAAARETIDLLHDRGASVVLATHVGSPEGPDEARRSMQVVESAVRAILGPVALLGNLRADPREVANDASFAREVVGGFDVFVNDAFATAHRTHASIVRPPFLLPSAAGRLLLGEVETLLGAIDRPPRPLVLVVGGAKIEDKLKLLSKLAADADEILVGGLVGSVFRAASGLGVGTTDVAPHDLATAASLLDSFAVRVPDDVLMVRRDGSIAEGAVVPDDAEIIDIGPRTRARFAGIVAGARTLLWCGPLGVYEREESRSTAEVCAALVPGCRALAGGGDTVAAIRASRASGCFSHLSTGGGAMLHLLLFRDLPALRALREGAAARAR